MTTHIEKEAAAPGEESVWDYPRPPRVEECPKHIEVVFNGVKIADTHRAKRVLETSHPPVYYIPPEDVRLDDHFTVTPASTLCEFKGRATYYTIKVGDRVARNAAWSYPNPLPGYEGIAGYLAFYPSMMDECLADGEQARPQPGGFYGGWITAEIKGPFKGEPGTRGW